jgi:hypothetical protein
LRTGKEVAKFSKIHYPQLLLEQLVANEGDVAMALRESFHRIDEELEDPVSARAWSWSYNGAAQYDFLFLYCFITPVRAQFAFTSVQVVFVPV